MRVQHTREMVQAAAAESFAPELVNEVMAVLDLYRLLPYERERERVQLAILHLSNGDLDKVRHDVAVAKLDYRDVLYWAEYPRERDFDFHRPPSGD